MCIRDRLVVEKRVADDLEFFGRVEHDVEIVLIAAHARDKAIPVSDFHFDVDLGKAPTEIPQHAWQKVAGSSHQSYPEAAALQALQVIDHRFEAAPDLSLIHI